MSDSAAFASNNLASDPRVPRRVGWAPGQSGNPKGRPPAKYNLPAMCREHTAEAVRALVELLGDEDGRLRLMAAQALLDRGYGRPVQTVADASQGDSLSMLHLLAAQQVSAMLARAQEPGKTVEAVVVDYSQPALE